MIYKLKIPIEESVKLKSEGYSYEKFTHVLVEYKGLSGVRLVRAYQKRYQDAVQSKEGNKKSILDTAIQEKMASGNINEINEFINKIREAEKEFKKIIDEEKEKIDLMKDIAISLGSAYYEILDLISSDLSKVCFLLRSENDKEIIPLVENTLNKKMSFEDIEGISKQIFKSFLL